MVSVVYHKTSDHRMIDIDNSFPTNRVCQVLKVILVILDEKGFLEYL